MSKNHTVSSEDLARQEKIIASRLDMSGHRVSLVGGPILLALSWFLPFTSTLTGLDLAFYSAKSVDYGIRPQERAFVWLCMLGPFALTLIAYFLKSTRLAQVSWIISGITMFFSIFAIWMRQTRDAGSGAGPGMIIAALAVLVVVFGLYNVVTLKSEEQEQFEAERRKHVVLDPVAQAQHDLLADSRSQVRTDGEQLVDDRRKRAARRREQS